MAMRLSMQDIFSVAWFSNALMNRAWTEMMHSSVNKLSRIAANSDLLGTALGGRLRGDAAMLRQSSSNVSEAQTMMSMAATAAGNLASQLKEAQKIAGDFLDLNPADPNYTALADKFQAQYNALSNNIDNIIKNTLYNGIALLDGNAWNNGDERLSVTRDANNNPMAASVYIQVGNDGFPLTFSSMAAEFLNIAIGHGLYDNPDVLTDLNSLQSQAQTLADLYSGRAGSLQSQATSLQSQAKILEEAAAQRAKTPTPAATGSVLLNLILRDSGGIFSGRG